MTATSTPGIVGTWFRNIEPNLPAPIRPTRTGRPGGGALLQQAMEVHGLFRRRCWSRRGRNRAARSSATGSIGVKSRCAIHSGRVGVRM